jgi:hypothetical protein
VRRVVSSSEGARFCRIVVPWVLKSEVEVEAEAPFLSHRTGAATFKVCARWR